MKFSAQMLLVLALAVTTPIFLGGCSADTLVGPFPDGSSVGGGGTTTGDGANTVGGGGTTTGDGANTVGGGGTTTGDGANT